MSTLAKNVPQVVYYQEQVDDFWAIFVHKHALAPGHKLCKKQVDNKV